MLSYRSRLEAMQNSSFDLQKLTSEALGKALQRETNELTLRFNTVSDNVSLRFQKLGVLIILLLLYPPHSHKCHPPPLTATSDNAKSETQHI